MRTNHGKEKKMSLPNHVKVYLRHFDIGEQDIWCCEKCNQSFHINNGLNIHHINGRGKDKDVIENLMSLCQEKCHTLAHASKEYVSKEEFQSIHDNFLRRHR